MGINDADYVVQPTVNGKQVMCPFYRVWFNVVNRCYNPKFQARAPTYIGCSVTPEWHSFMAFKSWMETQPWRGNELDKDLLIPGNKVYGPDTCVFVSHALNNFTLDSGAIRGEYPMGVSWHKSSQRLRAMCCSPFTGKQEHLNLFICEKQAHEAWRAKKHEHALKLADQQTDPRVAEALKTRYLPTRVFYSVTRKGANQCLH